jgi:hypothetical protein
MNMQGRICFDTCQVAGLDGDCWTWTGAATGNGYGSVGHEGRTRSTHKLSYELLIGPVPEGLQIDHVCLNKLCCNPSHLEPVTGLENVRRALAVRFPAPPAPDPEYSARLIEIFERFFGPSEPSYEPAS